MILWLQLTKLFSTLSHVKASTSFHFLSTRHSTVLIGLTLGKTYLISVIASNELTELFTEDTWINSTSSTLITLPEAVNLTVRNLSLESVDADQVNSSVSSVGVEESADRPQWGDQRNTIHPNKMGCSGSQFTVGPSSAS
ncbi:hypothetical protein AHF37_06294 [Paragonimus kellicotti]|nr:hypothetical protein AHF37_06294 [Paragonimus kellicotti]